MSLILFVGGDPGHGKSYLAKQLQDRHSFFVLSLDHAYVAFIKAFCPMLYFDAIGLYVGPHYDNILRHRDYAKSHFGKDFVAEWHTYLENRIDGFSARHPKLVVEGYVLHDAMPLESRIGQRHRAVHISVRSRQYFQQQGDSEVPISFDQIAAISLV
jgi:hypothetical protein